MDIKRAELIELTKDWLLLEEQEAEEFLADPKIFQQMEKVFAPQLKARREFWEYLGFYF